MTSAAPRLATLDDLLAIPEEERRHELIDGEIVEKGAASGEHGRAQMGLVSAVHRRFGRRPGGRWPGGWWFGTGVDVYFDPKSTLQPDIAGWRRERVPEPPRGAIVKVLPDWVCEILSTNRRNDVVRKKRVYHRHRIPHYWILDPSQEMLSVHRWSSDGYIEVLPAERGERVRAEPFDAVEMSVGALLGDEDDDE